MRNGNASLLFSLFLLLMEDLASTANVRSSMPSSTWCAVVVPGDCFPMTCLLGRRSIITFASGDWMEHGNDCIPRSGSACVFTLVEQPNQAQALLTVNPSRQLGWVDHTVMTVGKRSKVANGICSWIHKASCSKPRCIGQISP